MLVKFHTGIQRIDPSEDSSEGDPVRRTTHPTNSSVESQRMTSNQLDYHQRGYFPT